MNTLNIFLTVVIFLSIFWDLFDVARIKKENKILWRDMELGVIEAHHMAEALDSTNPEDKKSHIEKAMNVVHLRQLQLARIYE